MEAPIYQLAAAYEQPKSLPPALSARTSSIAELKEDPEAMAILRKMLPTMALAILRSTGAAGLIRFAAQAEGLPSASATLRTI